ncbi:MAG: hypothetical protein MMC33_002781 [Icmadophila ericetorum]|nr:hypothetical protein [Icmadophila ericetorum]
MRPSLTGNETSIDLHPARRPARGPRNSRRTFDRDRYSPEQDITPPQGAKLRVDNLHYDLTEDDLEDLFTRIGPISSLRLTFDKSNRSTGTAYVTYTTLSSARAAIREFDGANANGQPIRLALVSSESSGPAAGRGLFDRVSGVSKPGRSLFDRVEAPKESSSGGLADRVSRGGMGKERGRSRSRSPGAPRRTDTRKPAPEHIDRYVPGGTGGDRERGGRGGGGRGRRDDTRGRWGGGDRDAGGRGRDGGGRQGRPTQEQLDQEMEDYWGTKNSADPNGTQGATNTNGAAAQSVAAAAPAPQAAAAPLDDDIDMIE